MIDFAKVQHDIVSGLQAYLTSINVNCPVILANQTAELPDYPYVSFTRINMIIPDNLHYSVDDDGTKYNDIQQVWSFTTHSENDAESIRIAGMLYDWFSEIGNVYHSDNGIIVSTIGNVNNRDNLLTIEYEYRYGLDVTFNLQNLIASPENEELIESVAISYTAENENELIKEDEINAETEGRNS